MAARSTIPEPGTFEHVRAQVLPPLRPFVAMLTGYRSHGGAGGVHRGLPSPWLTLILTVDEPLVVIAHADPRQSAGRFEAVVGGLHTSPVLVGDTGRQWGVQVSLTPSGARALLGVPAAELASWDADLADVLPAAAVRELLGRLREGAGWPVRFAAVQDCLLRLLARDPPSVPAQVGHAWRLTLASHGTVRIRDLAARIGWSGDHLTRRFRAETGLTPKEVARIVRFDRARRLIAARARAGVPVDLAGLAATCGFVDQAHLAREWRGFAGLAPSRWLAEEIGFVQAPTGFALHAEGHD